MRGTIPLRLSSKSGMRTKAVSSRGACGPPGGVDILDRARAGDPLAFTDLVKAHDAFTVAVPSRVHRNNQDPGYGRS
ncbi:MAG: hypothetical protein KY458_09240 [Actinobacteria bacterium]|nr:hypothetical protein [Actinomycetota bacterium]